MLSLPIKSETADNFVTIAAIGLVAYASADIAHHAFGHGAACLMLGGRIRSLSSIFVDCSLSGAAIDLAGPFANLALGLAAILAARFATRASTSARLFLILTAAFNLLWLELQLLFSAATRTDDWAWPMHQFRVMEPGRYGMIAMSILAYLITVRAIAVLMAPFASPRTRAMTIVGIAWLTAGAIACATAAFDHNAAPAVLRHAVPQSLLVSIGLLFVPSTAARLSSLVEGGAAVEYSLHWVVVAAIIGVASILFLGPGIAIAI